MCWSEMKEEGAIDRIYQKVAENETGDSRDVMALFETSDFEVDVNFCDDMFTNGAAKNAMKMANARVWRAGVRFL